MIWIIQPLLIYQSLPAPHRHLPISFSSRSSSRICVSLSPHPCYLIVLLPVSSLRLVVVLLLRLVFLRRRSYPCRHRICHLSPPAHLSVHHLIVAVSHCPPPYCPIASLRSPTLRPYPYHHRHHPLPDRKIELTQTAHPFRHRYRPIGFHDGRQREREHAAMR